MVNRRRPALLAVALFAIALASGAALWSETATLDDGNGYRWEKTFKPTGPIALHVTLEPADAPVDAFLYTRDDEVASRASGTVSLDLSAPSAGTYTLAFVGGRKTTVRATVTAEAK